MSFEFKSPKVEREFEIFCMMMTPGPNYMWDQEEWDFYRLPRDQKITKFFEYKRKGFTFEEPEEPLAGFGNTDEDWFVDEQ